MEFRTYREYIGTMQELEMFLLHYFKLIHICEERHYEGGQMHIHAFLQEPKKPISVKTFKRYFQRYKKLHTDKKLRNNAFHCDQVQNEPCFLQYMKTTKQGGYKEYMRLRHPYCFDTNYYVGEL